MIKSLPSINEKYQERCGGMRFGKSVVILICIVCVIYNSGYALFTVNEAIGKFLAFGVTLPLFAVGLNKKMLQGKLDICAMTYILWIVICCCSILVNFSFLTVNSFILPILMVTFAFCLSYLVDFAIFSRCFIACMKLITIISLVVYVLVGCMGVNFNLPTVTNVNGQVYTNGIVFFILQPLESIGFRNCGIFWEPGLFASFLIVALIFEMYFKFGKMNLLNLLLFTLGILSTLSTAGYVALFFVFALLLCRDSKNNNIWAPLTLMILAGFLYCYFDVIIQFLLVYNYHLFIKLVAMSGSGSTRLFGPLLNLAIFKSYPVFGAGFYEANNLYIQNMFSFDANAQTSTSTYFMAALGGFGVLYTCLWAYGVWKIRHLHVVGKIALLCLILIILNKEPHSTMLFTYCFLFYLLKASQAQPLLAAKDAVAKIPD
jgi:hypothetical protein